MSAPFTNVYRLRKVAESDCKPCAFCFKPTSTVLITEDGSSDFFYTCGIHLKDPQFATPIHDSEYLEAQQKKKELDEQIRELKLKWDEKNRYAGWDKIVSYTKSFGKSVEKKDDKDKLKSNDNIEDQLKDFTKESSNFQEVLSRQPKMYQLNQQIYKMRLNKKRQKTINNQDRTSVKNISAFPSVPKNLPTN